MFSLFNFRTVNKKLLVMFFIILTLGLYSFLSAGFGILNRNEIKFYSSLETQITAYVIGIFLGFIIYFVSAKFFFKLTPFVYVASVLMACLTFVPIIGISHGGATRWLSLFGFSLQPAEILKLTTILWIAYVFKRYGKSLLNIKPLCYFCLSIFPIFIILFFQKDLGSISIIFSIIFSMYFLSPFMRFKYAIVIIISGIIFVSIYLFMNPYAMSRIKTLFNPEIGSAEYYQTEQAYIAVANGELYGRGIFSGIQKYKYLPEPAGDSIFATFAEETGFLFSSILVSLFFGVFIFVLFLAKNLTSTFEKYVLFGISSHMIFQASLNIGSMIGIMPLSGDILPFFSQGGTSLIINLVELAIILNFTKIKEIGAVS